MHANQSLSIAAVVMSAVFAALSVEPTSRRAVEHELELRARADGSPLEDAHRLVGCKP